jgi:hypothetical protein
MIFVSAILLGVDCQIQATTAGFVRREQTTETKANALFSLTKFLKLCCGRLRSELPSLLSEKTPKQSKNRKNRVDFVLAISYIVYVLCQHDLVFQKLAS